MKSNNLIGIMAIVVLISASIVGCMYYDVLDTQLAFNQCQTQLSTTHDELENSTSELEIAKQSIITSQSRVSHLEQELKKLQLVKSRTSLSRGGDIDAPNPMMSIVATAYTHTGDATRTGVMPKVGRTIAVDPKVIPLGSKVWIEGYGELIAEDTGGLIKGNHIDIFLNSRQECVNFGIKRMYLKILK